MVEWNHPLNRHEFEQTPEDNERQGSVACCSPWGHNDSMTEQCKLKTDIFLGEVLPAFHRDHC